MIALLCLVAALAHGSAAHALSEVVVRVVNADEETTANLQSRIENASTTRQAIEDEIENPEDQLAAVLSEYRTQIGVLYGQGYYGPEVSVTVDGREAADIDPFSTPDEIGTVVITVDPGRRFRFGEAEVGPRAPTAAATGAPVLDSFSTGEPAGSGVVGAAAGAAISEWRDEGHARAQVADQVIIARHQDAALDVRITLEPGPQLRFGSLTYNGESDVREKRIREMLGLPTGELVTPEELNDAADRLRRAGAFRTVALTEAETPNPDGTLDYELSVIDLPKRRFGIGAEFSTLEGALVSGFWLHRNLFGGAERLRFDAEIANIGAGTDAISNVGGTDYRLTGRLSRPAAWGPDNVAFLFGGISREDEPDFLEDEATLGIGLTRFFSDELFGEIAGGWRFSRVEDAFGDREFNHAIFPSRLELDLRDDPGDARRGIYVDVRATPAIGANGSENLVFIDTDSRAYFSPIDALTFAGRVQLGSTFSDSLEGVPPDFLFFSGGGDTVRGQQFQVLGGSERNGETVGGRSFLGLSTEIRARFGALGVVAFADFGYVDSASFIDENSNEHSGVGLGIRYATPIGPIRVDVATPLTGEEDDNFSRVALYIGVGQAF